VYRGIEQARIGNSVGMWERRCRKHVEAAGFSVVREFGRARHWDQARTKSRRFRTTERAVTGAKLREGMVLAIEPMVNFGKPETRVLGDNWTAVTVDGSFSAHFEHCVAVTKDGPMILTQ